LSHFCALDDKYHINAIEVDDDQIHIKGDRNVLERGVLADDSSIPSVRR